MSSIQTKALVVVLSISQWTARKYDSKATKEVNDANNAADDAGRYNKMLVDKESIAKIVKIAGRARDYHYSNTLPWGDNHERLLSVDNYFSYVEEMSKLRDEFDGEVRMFLKSYEEEVNKSRLRLGDLFNSADYPTVLQIESKFGLYTSFFPVQEADFRVQLNDKELESLKASVGSEINNRINSAVKDIWNRVKEQLTRMKERLSNADAIFRDSLFENLNDLIDLIPKLNVTGDIEIAKICNELSGLKADPETVRTNLSIRSQKAQQVDAILNKFGDFLS